MLPALKALSGVIPTEIESFAQSQGTSAESVYAMYLSHYARLARSAKLMSFVPLLAWRALQQEFPRS